METPTKNEGQAAFPGRGHLTPKQEQIRQLERKLAIAAGQGGVVCIQDSLRFFLMCNLVQADAASADEYWLALWYLPVAQKEQHLFIESSS